MRRIVTIALAAVLGVVLTGAPASATEWTGGVTCSSNYFGWVSAKVYGNGSASLVHNGTEDYLAWVNAVNMPAPLNATHKGGYHSWYYGTSGSISSKVSGCSYE